MFKVDALLGFSVISSSISCDIKWFRHQSLPSVGQWSEDFWRTLCLQMSPENAVRWHQICWSGWSVDVIYFCHHSSGQILFLQELKNLIRSKTWRLVLLEPINQELFHAFANRQRLSILSSVHNFDWLYSDLIFRITNRFFLPQIC